MRLRLVCQVTDISEPSDKSPIIEVIVILINSMSVKVTLVLNLSFSIMLPQSLSQKLKI